MSLEFIKEGHYQEGENEYMSIWAFKIAHEIEPNRNEVNFNDAKLIVCFDRKWLPFNQSNVFKEGWHYNIECLKTFYKH